jgi:hypothetical protein
MKEFDLLATPIQKHEVTLSFERNATPVAMSLTALMRVQRSSR